MKLYFWQEACQHFDMKFLVEGDIHVSQVCNRTLHQFHTLPFQIFILSSILCEDLIKTVQKSDLILKTKVILRFFKAPEGSTRIETGLAVD